MKIAEQVTFGTGRLDRATELRNDAAELARMARNARILPLWRGKPLIDQGPDHRFALAFLTLDHPILAARQKGLVFLGRDPQGPLFALDVSDWEAEGDALDPTVFFDQTWQRFPDTADTSGFGELRGVMAHLTPLEAEIAATARSILEWHRIHGFCANCGAKSTPVQAGWQRDCPDCARPHFPRTDPVVIMLITHGNAVLIGRNALWPRGMFSLLAGFMEPGETIEAATRREVFEETGVRVGAVDYLASQPWPYPSSLMIGTRGLATTTQISIDPDELEQARWVTREDMLEVFAGQNPDMLPARKGSIAHFLLTNWLADRLD
ncbi:NADH pyrophosphatase [Aliiroseovarius zhejiangensis]|uniref:NAD(+) diphosphatase n=1 Tax=Aliiroseovarius zhejiangensis TaxID=1632025 RepID=A0ABQ3IXH0_9RHOB|nr:NAD(+) diphosphatase [Aliiroseovarius zhejiangensis]GHE96461.1 NADH pyrophosphatase [Aliiroseovarius zhejiangensis]